MNYIYFILCISIKISLCYLFLLAPASEVDNQGMSSSAERQVNDR